MWYSRYFAGSVLSQSQSLVLKSSRDGLGSRQSIGFDFEKNSISKEMEDYSVCEPHPYSNKFHRCKEIRDRIKTIGSRIIYEVMPKTDETDHLVKS